MEQPKEEVESPPVEVMDVAGFREAYGPWFDEVKPMLEAADWKPA